MIDKKLICPHCLAEGELTMAHAFRQNKVIHTVCQKHGTNPYIGDPEGLTIEHARNHTVNKLKKYLKLYAWFALLKAGDYVKDKVKR